MTYRLAEEPFWSIQGEGLRTGEPTIFIRMAGCNADPSFQCWKFCDTKFARDPEAGSGWALDTLQAELYGLPPVQWVCLTGGEPLLQLDYPLLTRLHRLGLRVQVETNGTISPQFHPSHVDHWTISPKTSEVQSVFYTVATEFKYVIACPGDLRRIRPYYAHSCAVILQPESNKPEAVETCLEALKEHPDWRLGLQIHKIVGAR